MHGNTTLACTTMPDSTTLHLADIDLLLIHARNNPITNSCLLPLGLAIRDLGQDVIQELSLVIVASTFGAPAVSI